MSQTLPERRSTTEPQRWEPLSGSEFLRSKQLKVGVMRAAPGRTSLPDAGQ